MIDQIWKGHLSKRIGWILPVSQQHAMQPYYPRKKSERHIQHPAHSAEVWSPGGGIQGRVTGSQVRWADRQLLPGPWKRAVGRRGRYCKKYLKVVDTAHTPHSHRAWQPHLETHYNYHQNSSLNVIYSDMYVHSCSCLPSVYQLHQSVLRRQFLKVLIS